MCLTIIVITGVLGVQLIEQTNVLIIECERCVSRFYQMREQNLIPHFFDEVKPHADYIDTLLIKWQESANGWIKEQQPKYIHAQQISSVVEAMNQFVVQSFYKETSKKRFTQSVQSTSYTLNTLLRYLKEGEEYAFKTTHD